MNRQKIMSVLGICALFLIPISVYATTLTWYNDTVESSTLGLDSSGVIFAGEQVYDTSSALYGKAVNSVTLKLSKNSSPTANYYIGIWGNSSVPTTANYKFLISVNSSSALTTTPTSYTFTRLNNSYTMQLGDVVGIFFNGNASPNTVSFRYDTTASTLQLSYDGVHSTFQRYNTSPAGWSTSIFDTLRKFDMKATVEFTTSGTAPPNIVNGVDCSDPLNAQTLLCRMADIAGNPLTGASQTVGQSASNILNQIGLIDTQTNPDMKTNGVGYIMVVVSMGVFVGLLWVAGRGDLTSIPTFVWFIGTIAILGLLSAIEYIDPTFLIIGIITVIAFAVAKARNVFGGQTLFTGESG